MAVTIATSTQTLGPGDGRRVVVRTSLGVLWTFFENSSSRLARWYSTDDGATWTEDTSGPVVNSDGRQSSAIDVDDRIHLTHDAGSSGDYLQGILNGSHTELTWSTIVSFANNNMLDGDVVAFKVGSDRYAAVVGRMNVTNDIRVYVYKNGVQHYTKTFTSGTTSGSVPTIDFNHTGDGRTVASGSPHLWVSWNYGASNNFRVVKFTYAAGSWTAGTVRTVGSAIAGTAGGCFDGTRYLIAAITTSDQVVVYSRDAGDTATTTYAATPAKVVTDDDCASVSYDDEGNIYIAAVQASDGHVVGVIYDRAGGVWGSWTTIEAATAQEVMLQRGYRDQKIDAVWRGGSSSPFGIVHETAFTLNQPPTAATWVTVPGGHDRDEQSIVDWDFQDPDIGDTQSAYALSRVVNGGSTEYWDASGGTWGGGETKNATSTTSVTLAATWAADGDAVVYKVKTWDAADEEGVYSAALNVTASVKVNPTITDPAGLSTIATNTVSMTWTVAEQTAYRARLYNAAGSVTLEDSGWKTSTTVTYDFASILDDDTDYQVGIVTRNNEGLTSDEDTHTFSVDFVPPPTPTLTVAGDGDHIDVAITNPTPSGPEPALVGNDLYVRVASGRTDGYRPVGGAGIRIAAGLGDDAAFVDWAADDGRDYEYLARAFGDNGTSSDSTWTA